MDTKTGAPTAKIYQFPATTSGKLDKRALRPPSSTDRGQPPFQAVEFGSGWYHEAAVEAENPRKS
jgi:Protein of unknown function (DUF2735)